MKDGTQARFIMEESIALARAYIHRGEADKAIEALAFANDDDVIDALYDEWAAEQDRLERMGYFDED